MFWVYHGQNLWQGVTTGEKVVEIKKIGLTDITHVMR